MYFLFLALQCIFRNKALDEVQFESFKRGTYMKFGAENVKAISVFDLTILTRVSYCTDGRV